MTDYVVRPLGGVTLKLADQPRRVQDRFQRIASVLAMNPYPNPQFPLVTEDWAADGSKVYTYSGPVFPFAILYVIFEPTDEMYGMIVVIDLVSLSR